MTAIRTGSGVLTVVINITSHHGYDVLRPDKLVIKHQLGLRIILVDER